MLVNLYKIRMEKWGGRHRKEQVIRPIPMSCLFKNTQMIKSNHANDAAFHSVLCVFVIR